MPAPSPQPLDGLFVVSIEQAVAAPTCTLRLADAGARVIKIERKSGETARHYDRAVHGTSAYFAWLNRGKESCCLDLKNADDRALVRRMLDKADVFVQNFAPGAMARLGLDFETLSRTNPGLVMVSIVGYGQDTDYAGMRAYDLLVQAESGLCAVNGTPETACRVGVSVADIATGMNAHAAILQALFARTKTGKGAAIEMALFDCLADWMNVPLLHLEYLGRETPRIGLAHAGIHPYGAYHCRDGEVVIVVQNPSEWIRLCEKVLNRPDLVNDPRFHDNPARLEHRDALFTIIADIFATLTRREAIALLNAADLGSGTVSSVADLARHPALRRVSCTTNGETFSLAASPLAPGIGVRAVPALGEHTEAIRREFAT
ncbi:MAG: CoA transferase [Rhizobiales bacterium]|nr:CoA transferase [Hyphomicrobiales bacterium]